jgi:hypothetical protein
MRVYRGGFNLARIVPWIAQKHEQFDFLCKALKVTVAVYVPVVKPQWFAVLMIQFQEVLPVLAEKLLYQLDGTLLIDDLRVTLDVYRWQVLFNRVMQRMV